MKLKNVFPAILGRFLSYVSSIYYMCKGDKKKEEEKGLTNEKTEVKNYSFKKGYEN